MAGKSSARLEAGVAFLCRLKATVSRHYSMNDKGTEAWLKEAMGYSPGGKCCGNCVCMQMDGIESYACRANVIVFNVEKNAVCGYYVPRKEPAAAGEA